MLEIPFPINICLHVIVALFFRQQFRIYYTTDSSLNNQSILEHKQHKPSDVVKIAATGCLIFLAQRLIGQGLWVSQYVSFDDSCNQLPSQIFGIAE